jgi:hypothetical protein
MVAALLLVVLAGCGAAANALPNHSIGSDDSMSMTVEQYALGRLPGHGTCAKRQHSATKPAATKACPRK